MLSYKTFSLIAGLAIAATLMILARRSKIHSAHFLWWSAIICSVLLFAFFPTAIDIIGRWFGIAYPPIILAIAGIGLVLIKILTMDVYITQNELRYKKLAQQMALLENKLQEQAEATATAAAATATTTTTTTAAAAAAKIKGQNCNEHNCTEHNCNEQNGKEKPGDQ